MMLTALPHPKALARRTAWTAVELPDAVVTQALTMPLSMTLFAVTLVAWVQLAPVGKLAIDASLLVAVALVIALYHAAVRRCACDLRNEMLRHKLLAVLLVPPLMLTLLPLMAAIVLEDTSSALLALSLFNALVTGSCVFAALVVLIQVPGEASVRYGDDGLEWRCGGSIQESRSPLRAHVPRAPR